MILARLTPTVDHATFDAATCHRCGLCCQAFWLPSMLDPLQNATWRTLWALHDCDVGLPTYRRSALGRRDPGPAAIWSGPGPMAPRRPCNASDREWHEKERAFARWLLEIEPNLDGPSDPRTYRCPRYGITADGSLGCTRYDERPNTCSGFPYGRNTMGFPGCAWNVEIFDPEPWLGLETA